MSAEEPSIPDLQPLSLSAKGRTVKDPKMDIDIINGPKFVLRTVPDVQMNTRIIAVCGSTDADTTVELQDKKGAEQVPSAPKYKETGLADPVSDGWFFSDFYAFKHLLETVGASQKWITTENPSVLVQKYKEYLHGSPFYDRKVVLNAEMLARGFSDNLVSSSRQDLKETFKRHLKEEADLARIAKQPLMVLFFAHGDYETKGIFLGAEEPGNLFHIKEFQEIVGNDLDVTLVTTACFSGGWSIALNNTSLMAAEPKKPSESWVGSDSLGRFCGSMFSTALLDALNKESEQAEVLPVSTEAENQLDKEHTYAAFTEIVFDRLFEIDRWAEQHDIRFSAQDDDWVRAGGDRTGVPIQKFKERWDSLPTYPSTQDSLESSNRHSSNQIGGSSTLRLNTLRGRFASTSAAANSVEKITRSYLASFPGRDTLATNTALHGILRKFLGGQMRITIEGLLYILNQVQWRTDLMVMATRRLDQAGIARPDGSSCAEFDMDAFEMRCRDNRTHLRAKKFGYCNEKIFTKILPDPDPKTQGRKWYKPHGYIAAAIACDDSLKGVYDVDAALGRLEQAHTEFLKSLEKKSIYYHEEARSRKRAWYGSLQRRLRSLSPDKKAKRRSTGGTSFGSPLSPTPLLPRSDSKKGKAPADSSRRH